MHHNVVFEWTDQCSKAFNHLHELLMEYPIGRSQNTVPIASTQVAIKGIVQHSTRAVAVAVVVVVVAVAVAVVVGC